MEGLDGIGIVEKIRFQLCWKSCVGTKLDACNKVSLIKKYGWIRHLRMSPIDGHTKATMRSLQPYSSIDYKVSKVGCIFN